MAGKKRDGCSSRGHTQARNQGDLLENRTDFRGRVSRADKLVDQEGEMIPISLRWCSSRRRSKGRMTWYMRASAPIL
jgi:hypothetical protein